MRVAEIKVTKKKADAERSVNKPFVAAVNSSVLTTWSQR